MHAQLNLTADQLLSTTRSVRKRLDTSRRVPRDLIEECLSLAFQAPNGSNRNLWRWVVVDDPTLVREVGAVYHRGYESMLARLGDAVGSNYVGATVPGADRISESVDALLHRMGEMPALVIPLMEGRPEGKDAFEQACMWGSIIQAVWSLFLALRARGLGSAWTTLHILREREMAELLGIPYERYTQVGLFPLAYTLGTDFRPAWRKPVTEVVGWNRFEPDA
jgi:nitroreductase